MKYLCLNFLGPEKGRRMVLIQRIGSILLDTLFIPLLSPWYQNALNVLCHFSKASLHVCFLQNCCYENSYNHGLSWDYHQLARPAEKNVLEGSLQHRAQFPLVGVCCCRMGSEQGGHTDKTEIFPRQPCSVSFFKAVIPVHPCGSYHPVPISDVAVCSWMLLHTHCNYSGWWLGAQRNLL